MSNHKPKPAESFNTELDKAKDYSEVWKIVKETTEYAVGKRRDSMMLFLDDLPLQLGAYYPVGTNNIVLNRSLVEIVEASMKDKPTVNALIYNLLLHEYLHALGEMSETCVRREVAKTTVQRWLLAGRLGFCSKICRWDLTMLQRGLWRLFGILRSQANT